MKWFFPENNYKVLNENVKLIPTLKKKAQKKIFFSVLYLTLDFDEEKNVEILQELSELV